ncbi:MAG: hypothetical protein V7750_10235, partial [Sneathiella sp.]
LRELKKKKKELGVALNLPPSRISDIIKGTRRIQSQEIPRLSTFLKMDATTILKNIQEQSGDTEIELTSKTEQITVVGDKGEIGNNYNIWPVDQHYIITLPRQTSYGGSKKFALEENCVQANTLNLYICISENPKKKRGERALIRLKATPNNEDETPAFNTSAPENKLAFVIAYYEQN